MSKTKRRRYFREWCRKNREKRNATNKVWRRENLVFARSLTRAWKKAHPVKLKRCNKFASLRWKYGLSASDYRGMICSQKGRCAICKHSMKTPHVDHDHRTGKVRGLLCLKCNVVLGMAGDNKNLLMRAVAYLEKHNNLN